MRESEKKGAGKKQVRGIGLYFRAMGDNRLADAASAYREQRIAPSRKPMRLNKFMGVDPEQVAMLAECGIVDAAQMYEAARTPALRRALAHKTGLSETTIEELFKLSDISRIFGIKSVRARLYHDAGYDSVKKLAGADPAKLRQYLLDFVAKSGFKGIAPLPKELVCTIAEAKRVLGAGK
jgi:hypothetical protein